MWILVEDSGLGVAVNASGRRTLVWKGWNMSVNMAVDGNGYDGRGEDWSWKDCLGQGYIYMLKSLKQ